MHEIHKKLLKNFTSVLFCLLPPFFFSLSVVTLFSFLVVQVVLTAGGGGTVELALGDALRLGSLHLFNWLTRVTVLLETCRFPFLRDISHVRAYICMYVCIYVSMYIQKI